MPTNNCRTHDTTQVDETRFITIATATPTAIAIHSFVHSFTVVV